MSRDEEAYGTREAIAANAFGRWLAETRPYRGSELIDDTAGAMSEALNKAMRVQITPEFVTAMLHEVDRIGVQNGGIEAGLKAAFEAAGFEVVE